VARPTRHLRQDHAVQRIEIETPHGLARAHLRLVEKPRAALVLGHGAGGGVDARDLVAAADEAVALGFGVALVEQPYRVAGRRAPAPAGQLDTAWLAVIDRLRADELAGLPLVVGGRSSGARVACRTAAGTGAVAVCCLAFPLHPPGRPEKSRLAELEAVEVPVLVVQGARDPFGLPAAAQRRDVVTVPGDHSLRGGLEELRGAVRDWLRTHPRTRRR
jgi:predicted alpha/beta-hydrolase family hydrolase